MSNWVVKKYVVNGDEYYVRVGEDKEWIAREKFGHIWAYRHKPEIDLEQDGTCWLFSSATCEDKEDLDGECEDAGWHLPGLCYVEWKKSLRKLR
jgi:hypothetical protein